MIWRDGLNNALVPACGEVKYFLKRENASAIRVGGGGDYDRNEHSRAVLY
jgi:hypothetical protein